MISVIVPIYNAEKFLKECIDSILNQSYGDLEVILVNDGSTDSSLEIIEEYERRDKRVKVITKENGGQMSAWILGVENSSGEYIGFVDSDDYIDKEMYDKLLKSIEKNKSDISMCGRTIFDRFSEITPKLPLKEVYCGEDIKDIYKNVFPGAYGGISQARWDKLYKREIIVDNMKKYCKVCVRTMEDRFIVSPALLSAKTFSVVNEPLYHCRLVNNSSSKKARIELCEITELLYDIQTKILKDKGLFEEYKDELEKTRWDYLKMIVSRNIIRKNNLSFSQKKELSKKLLEDKRYRKVVQEDKTNKTKFGKFIKLTYKLNSPFIMTLLAIVFGLFEKENKTGF